jgi:hypothetical protein
MHLETINHDQLQQEASDENTSEARLEEIANSSLELARLVANNLATPPKLLTTLSSSQDFLTRRNVATNPNTPREILIKLANEFPDEFFANPILDLITLESPKFFEELIPFNTLISLIQSESASDYFLRSLENLMLTFSENSINYPRHRSQKAQDEHNSAVRELLLGMIKNPRVSADFIQKLLSHPDSFILENVELRIINSEEITGSWKDKAQKLIPHTQIANDRYFVTLKELEKIPSIINSPFLNILKGEEITEPLIPYLSSKVNDKHIDLSSLLEEVLTEYWSDKSKEKNKRMGYLKFDNDQNLDVLLKVLKERDSVGNEQENLASDPKTPREILAKLALVKDPEVREKVARNPQTPVKILEKLAKDENEWVRRSITENPNAPSQLLEELSKNVDFWMYHTLVVNPNTPSSTLAYLASFNDWELNQKILVHRHTNLSLLLKILKNDEFLCVRLLAKENIPDIILVELLSHPSEEVLKFSVGRYLAQHPDLVSFVIEKYPYYQTSSFSRLIILFHPETPNSFLKHAIASLYWIERFAVAQNPNTSRELLQILAQDMNQLVRAAATDNLQKKFT